MTSGEGHGRHREPASAQVPDSRPAGADAAGGGSYRGPLVTAVIMVLCALLGFAIVTQVRRTAAGDTLSAQRPGDLVQILDGLQQREDDLNAEIAGLEKTLDELRAGGASSGQALRAARRQLTQLRLLAGTVPANGPGVRITVTDRADAVSAEILLDVVQELRNAGAEVIEVGGVRIGMDSAFTGDNSSVSLDGTVLTRPIGILAIGDPPTLAAALAIPGGVVDTVERTGAGIEVEQTDSVVIDALREQREPQYARPAG